jgi:hypothetical protein
MLPEHEQTRRRLHTLVDSFVDGLIAGETPEVQTATIPPNAEMAFGGAGIAFTVAYAKRRGSERLPRVRTTEGCFALASGNRGQVETLIQFFGKTLGYETAIELATAGKEFLTDLSITDVGRQTNLLFKPEDDDGATA